MSRALGCRDKITLQKICTRRGLTGVANDACCARTYPRSRLCGVWQLRAAVCGALRDLYRRYTIYTCMCIATHAPCIMPSRVDSDSEFRMANNARCQMPVHVTSSSNIVLHACSMSMYYTLYTTHLKVVISWRRYSAGLKISDSSRSCQQQLQDRELAY